MSNAFLASAKRQIDRHGQTMTYKVVAEGTYDIETGSTTNTDTDYSVKMYKKHIRANQYNYPNLIGQDAALFYLANSALTFTPSVRDKIVVDSNVYVIESIVEHRALGAVVVYKILAVRG
jgi:hypothetical protein